MNRNPFADDLVSLNDTPAPPAYTVQQPQTQQIRHSYAAPPGPPPQHMGNVNRANSVGSMGSQQSARPSTSSSVRRSNSSENQLATLKRYDTVLLVDDSASMYPLWSEAMAATAGLAEKVIQYDTDGIDVYFLCSPVFQRNLRSPQEAQRLFQQVRPEGENTPTEIRVEELLSPYVEQCEQAKQRGFQIPKPLNLIVITDGCPDDPDSLAYIISSFADRLEEARLPLSQLGIQMVQIGNDPEASEALQELDDNLKNNQTKRDIVDTVPFQGRISAEFIIKALLGAINRRVDASTL